ncbi:MAG TPA: GNAT family protein [Anaerolineae bacterium]|nr:GNAT family protein [Anaerolineae bacterium]
MNQPAMLIEPITLDGQRVRLEPLSIDHLAALCEVGLVEEIWRWTTSLVLTPSDMRLYVEAALQEQAEGKALPFVTIDKASNKVVGSTRFGNIERTHRRVEIGWTWINPQWQRSHINTEAKYLMLRHAFETWQCIRVELKTDSLNEKSRTAMLRIGAKEEGTLRNHMITYTGRYRHSVYFSFIESEWPQVKANLETKMVQSR